MGYSHIKKEKVIALVAHDNRKKDMIEWVAYNWREFLSHRIVCTGTTGRLVQETLTEKCRQNDMVPPDVQLLKSGPLGGDQQLGAMISEGQVNMMIFFWDPMQAQPHDVDVKALLRISTLYNIPIAMNRSTADFMISSRLFHQEYFPILKDYSTYILRNTEI